MNRPVVSLSRQPKYTQKGQRIRRECFRPCPPGIVLMMVVFSSSPRQRKPVWMSMSLKRLSATVLMMLPKSRILKEALSGFVISCNASYHPRFCTIILGEKAVPICELSIIPFQEEIKPPWIGKH